MTYLAYFLLEDWLRALQVKWTKDGRTNYDTLRVLPEDLDLGAGY